MRAMLLVAAVAALSFTTIGVASAGYDSTPPPIAGDEGVGVWTRGADGRMIEVHQAKTQADLIKATDTPESAHHGGNK